VAVVVPKQIPPIYPHSGQMASTTELGGAVYTAAVGAMHLGQYRSRSSGGGGQSIECHWHPPGRVPRAACVGHIQKLPVTVASSGGGSSDLSFRPQNPNFRASGGHTVEHLGLRGWELPLAIAASWLLSRLVGSALRLAWRSVSGCQSQLRVLPARRGKLRMGTKVLART
jgi:hypothetical protein